MERHPSHPSFYSERDAAVYAEYHYRKLYNLAPNFPEMSGDELDAEYNDALDRRTQEKSVINSAARRGLVRKDSKTSKYVGAFLKEGTRWCARIQYQGKSIYIRSYSIRQENAEEKAARAYDEKALELYGETARTNFSYHSGITS